jgi:hypothetical protein
MLRVMRLGILRVSVCSIAWRQFNKIKEAGFSHKSGGGDKDHRTTLNDDKWVK